MRLTSVHAGNFKSLTAFTLDLPSFCCLVGVNGVGKSTVLQFIDFLSQQVRGELDQRLDQRGWGEGDMLSRLDSAKTVTFKVKAADSKGRGVFWSGTYNPYHRHCTAEHLQTFDAELTVRAGNYSIKSKPGSGGTRNNSDSESIPFTYQG